ncbi:MAG: potassium transporter KefB [Cytophagales bacterium]|uniref:monovalent cation:proton antiporter family protein n=1 Tax=Cyclobacterium marinum TaxID=104 RepID=UPI0011EFCCCD|nr:monovalent cation:proton antiporter family protein [Cyclobacterium marinum]MBI0398971.1 cation:proton antiporter [Cyclobacterium marinum]MBR9776007.1 potassium transporter KefB [Cytophagales bacterium]|tara:strand:+ start:22734 stop:24749 length:2016 start_codon:yes stop_codon:yes gene_type:complete
MNSFILAVAELPLLSDIVVIFGLATLVILVFMRLKLPTIIGYLLTGAIAGPYGLSLVYASTAVEVLSEIGVILLLFVIGLEFSLKSLMAIKKAVFIGGSLQVSLTIGATALISYLFGFSWNISVFFGFLFALSSTAIVLKLLQESGQVNTISGRTTLAILIFQDIIIVPLVLFTPMLAGESDNVLLSLFYMALKGGLVILLTILSAKYLIPQLLYRIAKTKNEELFLLSIIVTCFAVAYATSLLGLSLGLGAFLAGLIISESEYSHHATGKILPFREIFLSFFFVSVGMLFDISFLTEHLLLILALVALTFVVKFIVASLAVKSLGSSFKESFIVGFSIFQVGEFSLLLAKEGLKYELLDNTTYQFFLAISILTMIITPFVLKQREKLAYRVLNTPMPKKIKDRLEERVQVPEIELEKELLNDHLVIIGYGLNGRNLARAAKRAKINYVIIEMNPETVKVEAAKGEPIIYGDAGNAVVLEHVQIHKARVAVIAISNQPATTGIIMNIREASQNVFIIVRTRYVNEIESMLNMGADEVIPEEFETSIEIFTRVLNKYLVPKGEIDDFTDDVRFHNYEVFRTPSNDSSVPSLDIPEINFSGIKIEKDYGQFIGKSIKDSNLREKSGLNLVAIKREGKTLTDITGHTKIKLGDIVYVVGKPEALESFVEEVGIG